MQEQKIEISDLFESIHGEGPFAGQAALFIRFYGCLEPFCEWCDTAYSWGQKPHIISIADVLIKVKKTSCSLIVITGGEPFLHWEKGLKELHSKILDLGKTIQYETSGKVPIPEITSKYVSVVCSPKPLKESSTNSSAFSWAFLQSNFNKVHYYKFLWQSNEKQIKKFIEKSNLEKKNIFLMPEGASKNEQLDAMPEVWQICIKNNWKFSPRLHILSFDKKRGI